MLELGGGELECVGKGLSLGFGITELFSLLDSTPAGIRLGGTYQTGAGVALGFGSDKVNLSGCGTLLSEGLNYSLTRRGTLFDLEIQSQPSPIKLVLGTNGQLTGPATATVLGSVIVGYRTERTLERNVSDGTVVPGSEREQQIRSRSRRPTVAGSVCCGRPAR